MEQFIWQNKSWPHFFWNPQSIIYSLADLYKEQGYLKGRLESLNDTEQKNAAIECFTSEIINSYKLDNVSLDEDILKSIFGKQLGLEQKNQSLSKVPHTEITKLETIVSVFLEIICNSSEITADMIINWNKQLLFTTEDISEEDLKKINENNFRTVDYNFIKEEVIYYTAPAPKSLPVEIDNFVKWYNTYNSFQELDNILKSALTQFYLIAIHPFEKNNNILARMISYGVLYKKKSINSLSEDISGRYDLKKLNTITEYLYSVNEQTVKYKKDYTYMLIQMATGNMDMTVWLSWFIRNSIQAIYTSVKKLEIHKKAEKGDKISKTEKKDKQEKVEKHGKPEKKKIDSKTEHSKVKESPIMEDSKEKTKQDSKISKESQDLVKNYVLNKRQQLALEYMKKDSDGRTSSTEYAKNCNCSQDTASRDLEKLIKLNLVEKSNEGGRSTFYYLKK